MDGWIKIHRGILDWEWYSDTNVVRLFFHLLLKANFENKRWQGMVVGRGQIVAGRTELAKQTGLTEQQVRTAINKLKSTGEITTETTNKYTIITICNYAKYQAIEDIEQPTNQPTDNQQITNNQPTNNQQITTTQEHKKERKKENNIIPPLYPPQGGESFADSVPNEIREELTRGYRPKDQEQQQTILNELTGAKVEIVGRIVTSVPKDVEEQLAAAEENLNDPAVYGTQPLSTEGEEKEKSCAKKDKETKHKYGEYNNVLLTDSEAQKLRDEYGDDALPIVTHFSELKAMKGYKYKSDYLAIRKWGASAYYEHKSRSQNGNNANSFESIQERAARSVELGNAISGMWP